MRPSADSFDDGPGIHVVRQGSTTFDRETEIVEGNSSRSEACVSVDAAGVALCYAWKVDNSGPHSPQHVNLIYDVVHDLFPEATSIVASDAFDDFIADVLPVKTLYRC